MPGYTPCFFAAMDDTIINQQQVGGTMVCIAYDLTSLVRSEWLVKLVVSFFPGKY